MVIDANSGEQYARKVGIRVPGLPDPRPKSDANRCIRDRVASRSFEGLSEEGAIIDSEQRGEAEGVEGGRGEQGPDDLNRQGGKEKARGLLGLLGRRLHREPPGLARSPSAAAPREAAATTRATP